MSQPDPSTADRADPAAGAVSSAVTVCLVPEIHHGPWIFWHDLEAACRRSAQLGFDGIELFPVGDGTPAPEELERLLSTHGLRLAAVGTGAGKVIHGLTLTSSDPAVRREARAFVRAQMEYGAPFGAPAIVGSMQGNAASGDEKEATLALLAEALEELGAVAEDLGVPLVFEPLNRYESNLVNGLAAGVTLLESLTTGGVRLLADLFHMNIEEESLPAAIRAAGSHLGHVHFADSNRRPVGRGHLDAAAVAEALGEVGYRGFASAEAFPFPDPDAAAAQTLRAFEACFR